VKTRVALSGIRRDRSDGSGELVERRCFAKIVVRAPVERVACHRVDAESIRLHRPERVTRPYLVRILQPFVECNHRVVFHPATMTRRATKSVTNPPHPESNLPTRLSSRHSPLSPAVRIPLLHSASGRTPAFRIRLQTPNSQLRSPSALCVHSANSHSQA
jgi:hypothetical protein